MGICKALLAEGRLVLGEAVSLAYAVSHGRLRLSPCQDGLGLGAGNTFHTDQGEWCSLSKQWERTMDQAGRCQTWGI